jgi:hypothetical protein
MFQSYGARQYIKANSALPIDRPADVRFPAARSILAWSIRSASIIRMQFGTFLINQEGVVVSNKRRRCAIERRKCSDRRSHNDAEKRYSWQHQKNHVVTRCMRYKSTQAGCQKQPSYALHTTSMLKPSDFMLESWTRRRLRELMLRVSSWVV